MGASFSNIIGPHLVLQTVSKFLSPKFFMFFSRPVEYLSAKSSVVTGTSPSMSEDEDEEAAQRRMTLERWSPCALNS